MKLSNKGYAITIIVFGILIVFVIVLGSLLVTMNNTVKINKVVKEDVIENIQLNADTSGMSLTERIEQLEYKLSKVDGNIIDTIYPVGSVYISTTDSSIESVKQKFPETEWEVYAQGRTLVGIGDITDSNGNFASYKANQTGGNILTTLNINNLPKHSHVIPSLNGSTVESGVHTHTLPYLVPVADTNRVVTMNSTASGVYPTQSKYINKTNSEGNHSHELTTKESNTVETGSGASFSVQNPYITVYMYKRVK